MEEVVLIGVNQSLPRGVDDVPADADRAENLAGAVAPLAAALDDDADGGGGLVSAVDHAHLVVDQVDVLDSGQVILEGLAERAVEYDWITIDGQRYLLPVYADVILGNDLKRYYLRNVIELRNYHKFDTDLKILMEK